MSVTIEKINSQGFCFYRYDSSVIDFNDLQASALRVNSIISQLLSIPGESLYYDIDTVKPGMELKPHYHIIPGSFQVVVWIPTGNFTGRDFLFGTADRLRRFHPELGYMCFMKPNDPKFLHGVTKLQSQSPIKSIGFSSLVSKVEGNQDIYADVKSIDNTLTSISELL